MSPSPTGHLSGMLTRPLGSLLSRASGSADAATVLARAGLLTPVRPDRLLSLVLSLRYGPTVAAGYSACAARHPSATALIDDEGSLTFTDLVQRTDALAAAYAARGLGPGTAAGLLARNGRGFIEPLVALAKTGTDVVLLNTGMALPQIAEVVNREGLLAAVADDDLLPLLPAELTRLASSVPTSNRVRQFPPPLTHGRIVLLTSGTTGAPKGAARGVSGFGPALGLLDAIPYRARERTLLASPLFHAWGMANLGLAMLLGSTLVLRRRFDAVTVLRDIEAHQVTTLVAVPVMLQRMLDLPAAVRTAYDTSSLRVVAISGSALPARLATEFQEAFGNVIYNLYGSTEVGFVTVASPEDLRADPATAGHVLRGVTVRLVDELGIQVPEGSSGRIFVGSELSFEGYTGGEDKVRLDGLVSTGDTGRFDAGRLVIEGRDDDMVVSGGENVFPGEVEEIIAAMPAVREACVVGVPDEQFGQRLAAFVVADPTVDAEAVRTQVKSHLASFKVPRDVTFLDELPRNATGKVVKRQLLGSKPT